jgi:SAM-dependent methyltransferase
MAEANYESRWWGYIYDQMMAEQQDALDATLHFYQANLHGDGRVLECACGTGLILLPLLALGYDIYGFDISSPMLTRLRQKAEQQGMGDIEQRISVQNLESFRYDGRFEAILIPTNSFSMLPTQEAQIRALRTVHEHLAPAGKLLLDLRLAGVHDLQAQTSQGRWHVWTHPETGRPIRQRVDGRLDFNHQRILDQCLIEYENETITFPMTGRWIFKEEFVLLLRLAGFTHWASYSTPELEPLDLGPVGQHSYWIVDKG